MKHHRLISKKPGYADSSKIFQGKIEYLIHAFGYSLCNAGAGTNCGEEPNIEDYKKTGGV